MLISKNVSMNCKIKSGSNNCSLTDLNSFHLKNSLPLMNLVNNTLMHQMYCFNSSKLTLHNISNSCT